MWDRCPQCPSRKEGCTEQKFVVPGDGPIDAPFAFVGEGPGKEENNRHRPFLGKSGDEFNGLYLHRAGLERKDVYVTNTFKCHWADSGDAPEPEVYKSCAEFHLRRELATVKPKLVVLMGAVANDLLGLNIEMEHGIYRKGVTLLGHTCDVYSTFHPALGLHMGSKMQALLDDFRDLRAYIKGKLQPLKIVKPSVEYYERLYNASEVHGLFDGVDLWRCAVDTESFKRWKGFKGTEVYTPDRLTFCIEPPHAYMVMRRDKAMGAMNAYLKRFRKLYLHNAPHDVWACDQMGVELPWDRVYDTMSAAYHDGRIARGLKYLAYKFAGLQMTSFDDVVVPFSMVKAMEYIEEVAERKWPDVVQEPTGKLVIRNCTACKGKGRFIVGRGKAKVTTVCSACDTGKVLVPEMTRYHSLNQTMTSALNAYLKGDIDIWDRWEKWTEKEHLLPALHALIAKSGPIPLPSIEYVPEQEAMVYACGDAVGTRIIGPIMEKRNALIRRSVRG